MNMNRVVIPEDTVNLRFVPDDAPQNFGYHVDRIDVMLRAAVPRAAPVEMADSAAAVEWAAAEMAEWAETVGQVCLVRPQAVRPVRPQAARRAARRKQHRARHRPAAVVRQRILTSPERVDVEQ